MFALHLPDDFAPTGKCVISRIHSPKNNFIYFKIILKIKSNQENHQQKEDPHHKLEQQVWVEFFS
jgi:hypothetical protein